jgi:glycosyltransferase involved in cell wall biosynthesis
VTIVATECGDAIRLSARRFGTTVIEWTDEVSVMAEFATANLAIYQVGDNYSFHGGIVTWLPRIPGIVCLHDNFIAHFFAGWAESNREAAETELRRWYGETTATRFFGLSSKERFATDVGEAAPLTEWVASRALGVVTHSDWELKRIKSSCAGPVLVVPFAYEDQSEESQGTQLRNHEQSDRISLLTVGTVNRNKRVDSVIRAIGQSPLLRRRIVYRLIGLISADTVLELSALATAQKVNLVISGPVDDALLDRAFVDADIVSCLRWPTLEAASASAIQSMLRGKPTIVSDTSFYHDVPETCVVKVNPSHEVEAVRNALEHLCLSRDLREELGARAKQWASVTFTAERYYERIVDLVSTVRKQRPILEANAFFQGVLGSWGVSATASYMEDIAFSLPTPTP